MPDPLQGRPDLRTESPKTNALARELHQLATRNGLCGCVLISFTADRVGVNSCGEPDSFGAYMERLGDRLLAAIDDGLFDPEATPNLPERETLLVSIATMHGRIAEAVAAERARCARIARSVEFALERPNSRQQACREIADKIEELGGR